LISKTSANGEIVALGGKGMVDSFGLRLKRWFPAFPISFNPFDGAVVLCDTRTSTELSVISDADDFIVSADGNFLATYREADRTISIWDIPPRKPLGWFLGLAGVLLLLTLGGFWWQVPARREKRKAALATEAIPCGT